LRDLGIDLAGKISRDVSAEPGRALGRLTDLGWGPRLRALVAANAPDLAAGDPVPGGPFGPAAPDGPAPDGPPSGDAAPAAPLPGDVLAAVVNVLAGWNWAERPAAVVSVPSRTRPELIGDLAARIADIGRLPYLGALEYTRDAGGAPSAPARQHNSAQRLRAVWPSLVVPASIGDALASLNGPVLLVDDRTETGWTLTVGAMRLREAGACAVLPFVLAALA